MADNGASTSAAGAQEDRPISVLDRENWERKHLPELGYDEVDSAVFRWPLKDYSWDRLEKRRQKLYSDVFECAGYKWKLMLFCGGVLANDPGKVSIYLVCASTDKERHPCAQMAFAMSNPNDPTVYLTYNSYHRFTPHDDDWGFTYFCNSERLREPVGPSRTRPLLEDDHVLISVFVKVVRDPTGVLWYNLGAGYCPRATTGMMNITSGSPGATSFNLALQLLYLLAPIRKAVYSLQTGEADGGVWLALQKLFHDLQASSNPVSHENLRTALEWSDGQLRRWRHDVMSYIRPILAILDEATPDHSPSALFTGEAAAIPTRPLPFDALTLDVTGMADLRAALAAYKQQVSLTALPNVLVLQLQRWTWDSGARSLSKVEDALPYPGALHIDEGAPYALHGVLYHDPVPDAYALLLRAPPRPFWVRCDGSTIVPVRADAALQDARSGGSAACALVYIRSDQVASILAAPVLSDVPAHVRAQATEDADDGAPVTVAVAGRRAFRAHSGADVCLPADLPKVSASPDTKLSTLLPAIAKAAGLRAGAGLILRALVRRHSRALRPGPVITVTDSLTLREAGTAYQNVLDGALLVFVEEQAAAPSSGSLIFLKHFDARAQTLRGAGAVYVAPSAKVGSTLRSAVTRLMKWPASAEVEMFEEVMPGVTADLPVDGPCTFAQAGMRTGDVVLFNKRLSSLPRVRRSPSSAYLTARDYFATLPRP